MAFCVDVHVGGDGLGAVGGDGAVVTGAAVVEEDVAVLGPELVADRSPAQSWRKQGLASREARSSSQMRWVTRFQGPSWQ